MILFKVMQIQKSFYACLNFHSVPVKVLFGIQDRKINLWFHRTDLSVLEFYFSSNVIIQYHSRNQYSQIVGMNGMYKDVFFFSSNKSSPSHFEAIYASTNKERCRKWVDGQSWGSGILPVNDSTKTSLCGTEKKN